MTLALLLSALLIFAMRIADVSLGTMRIVMLVRGRRGLAGLLGFFESLIWLLAASQVIGNLDNPLKLVAYAGGYAAGTMLGATIERWIAMGQSLLRIVTPVATPPLAPALRKAGFYVTVVNAEGRDGDVQVSFSVIPRRRMHEVLEIVRRMNPKAFVTFEEVRSLNVGPPQEALLRKSRV
ncbi:MAG: DUF2179 domain-containing protein [Deinococcota bacterium]|jgi:uncharacterized protein YebE (UPF0316 family)|nr:DUF2179 domain-containing protein [Deinococcota bacterium]